MDTLRQEGLARCSRPFALPGGGARLVTMQLGPGFLRGDRFDCCGSVGARAELAVVPQAATRALGDGAESVATAAWRVGPGGTLRLLGEPLVLYDAARHRSSLDVDLEAGATFVYVDVIAARGPFASVTTRLTVRSVDRPIVRDALQLTPARLSGAVGSGYFLSAGATVAQTLSMLARADAAAADVARVSSDLRAGVGSPAGGGVAVRVLGPSAVAVRAALLEILARAEPLSPGYG